MGFADAKKDWQEALNSPDPSVRIQHRLLLKTHGSEFGFRRVYDPRRLAFSTAAAVSRLMAFDANATEIGLGSRALVIPRQSVGVLEEINLKYAEAAGGAITANMNASLLELLVGGEALSRFPQFRLDHFHKGDNGLLFGSMPLGITVQPEARVGLLLTGGGGADSMDVRVSLTVRFEPLWLWKLAGLSLQDEPG